MRYMIIALLSLLQGNLFAQENFVIQLGDKTIQVGLDSTYQTVVNGQKLSFSLKQKDTLSFKDQSFGFSYPKGVQYAKTNIENGIDQYTVITADGAGFIVQKYLSMNPTLVNEVMLQEVTKESISYGYKEQREQYTRKLKSGQTLTVTKSVLTYKDDVATYEVASIGGKDEGLLVVTINPSVAKAAQANALIKLMWESLTYH